MVLKQEKMLQWAALLAGAVVALQMAIIVLQGEPFCPNEGCRIIEQLTTVPPIFFNLAGLFYFLAVFWVSRRAWHLPVPAFDWLRLLLLAGLAAEGGLVGYQLFVVQTFCAYCLVIFSFILLLNICYGRQQLLLGVSLFLAVLMVFAALNFGPALLTLRNQTIASGTFAVKRCAEPSRQLFFFFSADCPHCRNVLAAMENCNNCEVHFNPVEPIRSLELPGLEYTRTDNPALNRLILSLLQIETIPVLLVQNPDGLNIIKGEANIINFISQACFLSQPLPSEDNAFRSINPGEISVDDGQNGECSLQVECPDATQQSTPQGSGQ